RISGRRTCSLCNKVFNIYTAPPASPAGDCVAGSSEHQLFQRKDDEEATVKERLRVYEEKTRPVLSYYSSSGLLRTVRAEGSLEEITERLLTAVADAVAPASAGASKTRVSKPAGKKTASRKRVVGRAVTRKKSLSAKRASKKAAKRGGKVAVKRASKPAAKRAGKPAAKRVSKSAAKRAGKPAAKRASKSAAKRGRTAAPTRKSARAAKRQPRRHR
ncbi:MAG TPA: hypothetical protein VM146_13595, partial [Steroidobacteraceae bacterium]|nr:hypothetical protein [Steroidobacteraceae bacterium]